MKATSLTGQTTLQKKSEINNLLSEAIEHHEHCEAARASVRERQQLALWHAWQVGIRLNSMKGLIRRGDWLDWLDLHFCRPLKISVRTAQVYMKIDSDNATLRAEAKTRRVAPTEADFQLVTKLKFDTIRKYAIGFIPEKERPNEHRDVKLERLATLGNLVNEYERLKYRHISGRQHLDFEKARKETYEMYLFLQWLHADSVLSPWDSAVHNHSGNSAARRKAEQLMEIDSERFRKICALE